MVQKIKRLGGKLLKVVLFGGNTEKHNKQPAASAVTNVRPNFCLSKTQINKLFLENYCLKIDYHQVPWQSLK